jgi:hypothetical protein
MRAAGNAILGAASILRRDGTRVGEAERAELLQVVEELARQLAGPAAGKA